MPRLPAGLLALFCTFACQGNGGQRSEPQPPNGPTRAPPPSSCTASTVLPATATANLNAVHVFADGTFITAGDRGTLLRGTPNGIEVLDGGGDVDLGTLDVDAMGRLLLGGRGGALLQGSVGSLAAVPSGTTEDIERARWLPGGDVIILDTAGAVFVRSSSTTRRDEGAQAGLRGLDAGDDGTVVAVGGEGHISVREPGTGRWSSVEHDGLSDYRAVRVFGDRAAVVAGRNGGVVQWSASGWGAIGWPVDNDLVAIGGATPAELVFAAAVNRIHQGIGPSVVTEELGAPIVMNDIAASGPHALIVGRNGALARRTAAGWTPLRPWGYIGLDAARTSDDRIVVVGYRGQAAVISADLATSVAVTATTSRTLEAVAVAGDTTIAVGAGGTVLRLGADVWIPEALGADTWLRGVAAGPAGSFIAVGDDGAVYVRDSAGRWRAETSGVTADLFLAASGSGGEVWVVGRQGTLLRRDASGTWSQVEAPDGYDLYAVAVDAAGRVHVGGAIGGPFTRGPNGGWTPAPGRVATPIRALAAHRGGVLFAGDAGVIGFSADSGGQRWLWSATTPTERFSALIPTAGGTQIVALGPSGVALAFEDCAR